MDFVRKIELVRDWPFSHQSHFLSKNGLSADYSFESSINDDFKRVCVTGDHSHMHSVIPASKQYLTTTLVRILFTSVVMALAFRPCVLGSNPAWSLYFCSPFLHFFLCYGIRTTVTEFPRVLPPDRMAKLLPLTASAYSWRQFK